MKYRYVFCTAMAVLAMTSGCKPEEPKPATAPTPPTRPQPAEKPATAPTPAEPARTVGQTFDDATITAKVKAALLQSPDVKGTDVNVDTVGGKVTLKGALDAQIQIDRAIQLARGAEGVKDVESQLKVKTNP